MSMRVTNNMILKNSSVNINGTKLNVNDTNLQMTTQKKISRPSEDPVSAIRSLRFSTSLSQINQYYKKNIPDAESWLDVTETALLNMKKEITNYRTLCDQGANGTLTQDDRNTILKQLKSLQEGIYAEGNADYAGRTVFTGYRTDQTLTFSNNETDTQYEIAQHFTPADMDEYRYYNGEVTVPKTAADVANTTPLTSGAMDMEKTTYTRVRLAYDGGDLNSLQMLPNGTDADGNPTYKYDFTFRELDNAFTMPPSGATDTVSYQTDIAAGAATTKNGLTFAVFDTEADWAASGAIGTAGNKDLTGNQAVYIKETGELILGEDIAAELKSADADINVDYTKKGFAKGELKPEYYYNCIDQSDPNTQKNWIQYTKYNEDGSEKNYDIEYIIASNQPLAINLEACDIFDSSLYQDMTDAIDAVSNAIDAHDKLSQIEYMLKLDSYQDSTSQAKLNEWKEAIQKEADYYDDNLQKLFSRYLGKADDYLGDLSLAITQVGCKADQLALTEDRMDNQQETVMDLQSKNDDMDLSEIILKYTAAYTAYQASLTAAGKLGEISLLNYI